MIDETIPFDAIAAHAAGVALAGGPVQAIFRTPELVELELQMEALGRAQATRQTDTLVQIFRQNAGLALRAIEARQFQVT